MGKRFDSHFSHFGFFGSRDDSVGTFSIDPKRNRRGCSKVVNFSMGLTTAIIQFARRFIRCID